MTRGHDQTEVEPTDSINHIVDKIIFIYVNVIPELDQESKF